MHTRIGFLGALFVLFAGTPVAAQQNRYEVAPADEYFGRLRMSILGISNTIRDGGARLDRGVEPARVIDSLFFAEDAIHDWERQYPRDPWIPRSLNALYAVYARIPSERGASCARRVATWLNRDYASAARVY
ncbi:MAG: hypothetical protein JO349_08065 [Candidatus Eremiobacteraeota bacterium]|nr:hypothetical protein [Candidatus Eremiobacteraeota bacterium]